MNSTMITAVWPGSPYPRGATWDGEGVNFALFSENAERVELCIFDPTGKHEVQRIHVREQTDMVWHCYLPEARPGLLYGYRVHGPYDPVRGHRFNAHKLLIDPYAMDIVGTLNWSDAHFGYRVGHRNEDMALDRRDNAADMLKCRVADPAFSWGADRSPKIPWHEMVIYELHVRGFTKNNPAVPPALRGTYAGLGTAPVIEHLKRLGVTSVELMPTHSFIDDRHLVDAGKRNYWGYNSIGFFAPDQRYCASGSTKEFKTMVKTLHSAGIEVILDVVYNHTAEGNHLGPTLSFKGIDNASYYRLVFDNPRYYMDYTGCGNTLNLQHPRVLQMIMDSLRYWVQEMHVDGFRFDLAASLAREMHEVDRLGAFFDILHQDPVLSQVKLIAEPWDLGEGGYQVGNFPLGWAEWNDHYRDSLRSYWKGDGGLIGEFARRLTGSSDLYAHNGRRPYASINFITAHDGFTLHDLVSYNDKHNEANGEDNRDGSDNNNAWNCGVEGPTDDPQINALRALQKRNLLATLLLSQGVPMLLAGDEMGRTPTGQQQRLLPGQRNQLGQLVALGGRSGIAGFRHPADQIAPRPSGIPAAELLPGPADSRVGYQGHPLDQTGRYRDERQGMGAGLRPQPRGLSVGRCPRRGRCARPGDPRRQFHAAVQRPPRTAGFQAAEPVRGLRLASRSRYPLPRRTGYRWQFCRRRYLPTRRPHLGAVAPT